MSVPLPHPLVSRRHCEIVENDGRLLVRDLNSLNGTFIGEERISEAILSPGSLLTVGTVTFRAVYDESAGRKPPKPGQPAAAPAQEDSVLEIDSVEEVLDVDDIDEIVNIDDELVEEVVGEAVDVVEPELVGAAEVVAVEDSAELLDLDEVEIMDDGPLMAGANDSTERERPPAGSDEPIQFAEPDEADLEPPKTR